MSVPLLGYVAAAIVAASAIYYLVDVLRGRTRPQRTSWGVWAVVGVLGYGSSEAGGAGPGAYATAVDTAACIVTFALSVHPRYGKPGGRRLDPLLGVLAVAGVVLWRWGPLTDAAAAACAVGCEIAALWPTLRAARTHPELESLASWAADLVGHVLGLGAVATFSPAAFAFPLYMVVATAAVTMLLVRGRRRAGSTTGRRARARVHAPAPPSPRPA